MYINLGMSYIAKGRYVVVPSARRDPYGSRRQTRPASPSAAECNVVQLATAGI